MADIHEIIRKIRSRTALRENLSAYLFTAKRDAARLSYTDLSLHAVSLYEDYLKDEADLYGKSEVFEALSDYRKGQLSLSRCIEIRKMNAERMQTVSCAIDRYTLSEYLLNRIEHRFTGERELPEDYADLAFSEEIMGFFSQKKDEARGLAAAEILAELPVRMTKERFLEIMINRLGIYRSSDTLAFDNILSQLQSAAGIGADASDYDPMRELTEILGLFRSKNAGDFTEEEYFDLQKRLLHISVQLNQDSERAALIAAVLNNLEALLLSGAVPQDTPEYESTGLILEKTVLMAEKLPENDPEMHGAALDLCRDLEGHLEDALETYLESISFAEDLSNRFSSEIAEYGLQQDFEDLLMIRDLRSESTYPEERSEREEPAPLDTETFDRKVRSMLSELSDVFSQSKRTYIRAVMGRMLSVLPPVFTSAEELENYIYAALSGCRDTAEKLGCIELIRKLMEQ